MNVFLDDRGLSDLKPLKQLNETAIDRICKIAAASTQGDVQRDQIAQAASESKVEFPVVANAVAVVAYIYAEASKLKLTKKELTANLHEFEVGDAALQGIVKNYVMRTRFRGAAKGRWAGLPSYFDLHWRLDVEVASRMQLRSMEPSFVMRLDTKKDEDVKATAFQCDFATVKSLKHTLATAKAELAGAYASRVSRYVK